MEIEERIQELIQSLPQGVTLVAVSKTYPPEDIMRAYDAGQRVFGENRPQELKAKHTVLPKDIRWHMIGHLQTNKVKYLVPFVDMIESVDSLRLLETIEKEAAKADRIVNVLLEIHIAREESKTGWNGEELLREAADGFAHRFPYVNFCGVMGIASLTDDNDIIRAEFMELKSIFDQLRYTFGPGFKTLSMGMTSDYRLAIECGSNMIRIGSLIFGKRK